MVELRDYQQDLLGQVQAPLADPKSGIMLQLPTGGGKTCIAAALLSDWLHNGRKAVWLTHRRELAGQTEEMLRAAGVPASANIHWTPQSSAPALVNGAVILMAQTVSRRAAAANVWSDYDYNDLLIIDEAHHATAGGWARAISQWPGPVLGMTATPWRLSLKEGFEHLFSQLHCGPPVAELQAAGWLCRARVLAPPEEEQIRGGELDLAGDYSEAGIEQANQERDLWTAGALRFWQRHGENRQTIIYAVSVRHARNLAAFFNAAGIATGVLLGATPEVERAELLYQFRYGGIRVLVNVAVATEGFDLPDAACIVLTRPTLSLSLYLQMVGRGLRPKEDAGDCVVLDLAGNSRQHGLPDQERQWSLQPRGTQIAGDEPPVIRCPQCEELSPAASQQCQNCGYPFGELCYRCGVWRAWGRWRLKTEQHPQRHDPVCDRCHYDAHIQANLPVTEEMRELAELQYDDELSPQRDPFLKNFLLEELQRFGGATERRKDELRQSISRRDDALADDDELERQFRDYLNGLPAAERPRTMPQRSRQYTQWETDLRREVDQWQKELAILESQVVDGQQVFDAAQKRLLSLLAAEGRELGLLPVSPIRETLSAGEAVNPALPDSGTWLTFVELGEWGRKEPRQGSLVKPWQVQLPTGETLSVGSRTDLIVVIAEWLIRSKLLTRDDYPVQVGRMNTRYLFHETPRHPNGRQFWVSKQLSNGLYVELQLGWKQICSLCGPLVEKFGQDPAQFRVWVR